MEGKKSVLNGSEYNQFVIILPWHQGRIEGVLLQYIGIGEAETHIYLYGHAAATVTCHGLNTKLKPMFVILFIEKVRCLV